MHQAMIDAKLKGEGLAAEEEEPAERGNLIDLMAALKKSLGQPAAEEKSRTQKTASRGKPAPKRAAAQAASKSPRKRA
jgi:DNA end-binding protein Ku